MIQLCDAHLHLQDPALQAALADWAGAAALPQIAFQLTNGTHPEDWPKVAAIEGSNGTHVLRAYGVHPWRVKDLPDDWLKQLRGRLVAGAASVGEIGLDHWIQPHDPIRQRDVFMQQLELAAELGLPPSIHCLRAWGSLLDCLRAAKPLARGFLVHGFGGSVEILHQLADLGGHFSFSAYASDPARQRMRLAIRACPADRLLLETDAPDMVPPPAICRFPLHQQSADFESHRMNRRSLHHPAEIATACDSVANIRGDSPEAIAHLTSANFRRLFVP